MSQDIDIMNDALLFTKVALKKKFPHISDDIDKEFDRAEGELYARQEELSALSPEILNDDLDIPW